MRCGVAARCRALECDFGKVSGSNPEESQVPSGVIDYPDFNVSGGPSDGPFAFYSRDTFLSVVHGREMLILVEGLFSHFYCDDS